MGPVYCNQCGHRNPGDAAFCSSCGALLDRPVDHTVTLAKVDPLQESLVDEDPVVHLGSLATGVASLVVRSTSQAGATFPLTDPVTRLGRHPDSEIMLDDITVSRRHAEVVRSGSGYEVHDAGSLNGTYVNHERVDHAVLRNGDELQVGKFRLVFFELGAGPG